MPTNESHANNNTTIGTNTTQPQNSTDTTSHLTVPAKTVIANIPSDSITHSEGIIFVTPEELFGHQNKLIAPKYTTEHPPRVSTDRPIESSTQVASIVLIIICFYSFLIYRFIHPIRLILKNIFSVQGTLNYIETPSQDFVKFLSYGQQLFQVAIALTTTTILSVKVEGLQTMEFAIFGITWLALLMTSILQAMFNNWCGRVSTNTELFSDLQQLRKFNIAAFTLVYAPVAILATFSYTMTIAALSTIGLLTIWHILRVLIYLKYKKISFLQWFLYLCTTELLPYTVMAALLSSLIRRL